MRVLIATDAWYPQVNGVVRTLNQVADHLTGSGHELEFLTPEGHWGFSMPSYPEIKLAFPSQREIARRAELFQPDAIHIATEGPVGRAMRKYCIRNSLQFTTSYHTRFPEYVAARIPVPGIKALIYRLMRRFHAPSRCVLTPTPEISRALIENGFANVKTWTRGVDHSRFRPLFPGNDHSFPGPVMVYVGRIALEKNIEDFLKADVPGTKLVIGDGPQRADLERKYPDAVYTGYLFEEELVRAICAGDIFVFPSRTDTFGLVMLEAMACGLPVAGYPVAGPIDVVEHGVSGWLDDDLEIAIKKTLCIPRQAAIDRAAQFTWEDTAKQFLDALVNINHRAGAAN